MAYVWTIAADTLLGFLMMVGVFLMLIAAELAWPKGEQISRTRRWRNVQYALLFSFAGVLVAIAFSIAMRTTGLRPLFELPENMGFGGILLATIAGAYAYDFLYYWLHRAQHAVPFLWRFHAVHHAIEEMGATSGYMHVTEPVFRAVAISLPLSLIVSTPNPGVLTILLMMHGYYLHSATSVNFGRFRFIIADNRAHRLHHSTNHEHFERNFGVTTMLWDWMFGTLAIPKQGEWPEVGLAGRREVASLYDYLLPPAASAYTPQPELGT